MEGEEVRVKVVTAPEHAPPEYRQTLNSGLSAPSKLPGDVLTGATGGSQKKRASPPLPASETAVFAVRRSAEGPVGPACSGREHAAAETMARNAMQGDESSGRLVTRLVMG